VGAVPGVAVQILERGREGAERVVGEAVSGRDGSFSVILGR